MKPYIALSTLLLFVIACGQSLPTATQPAPTQPTAAQIAEVKAEIVQVTAEVSQVTTLGQVNIRSCPATDCEVLGVVELGTVLEVGALVTNAVIDCPRWYPVMYNGRGAFICAEWTTP